MTTTAQDRHSLIRTDWTETEVRELYQQPFNDLLFAAEAPLPATKIADGLGSAKVANVVMVGLGIWLTVYQINGFLAAT